MDKLNVFISWSGPRSLAIAKLIREWLPAAFPLAAPWLSDEDIHKGSMWSPSLIEQLEVTGAGIFVVTPENLHEEWLLFEAGAISKGRRDGRCCPLLCGLKPADVLGPLSLFQCTEATEEKGMRGLVQSLNELNGKQFDQDRLNKWFAPNWGELQNAVIAVLATQDPENLPAPDRPTERELLEEVLAAVRRLGGGTPALEVDSLVNAVLRLPLHDQLAISDAINSHPELSRRIRLARIGAMRPESIIMEKMIREEMARQSRAAMTHPDDSSAQEGEFVELADNLAARSSLSISTPMPGGASIPSRAAFPSNAPPVSPTWSPPTNPPGTD